MSSLYPYGRAIVEVSAYVDGCFYGDYTILYSIVWKAGRCGKKASAESHW